VIHIFIGPKSEVVLKCKEWHRHWIQCTKCFLYVQAYYPKPKRPGNWACSHHSSF